MSQLASDIDSQSRDANDSLMRPGRDDIALSAATLRCLPARLEVPRYERSSLRSGIAHIGVGAFHRSHQAVYIDRLLNQGLGHDWAITGVGVLDSDAALHRDLTAQDCLYTVIEKQGEHGFRPAAIGSLIDHLHAPADPEAVVGRLAHPATRMVTLTITEGGYGIDDATGEFRLNLPDISADLKTDRPPKTVFGLVTAALARRYKNGQPPFTIASCDNLPGNGAIAKHAFTAFADLKDPALANWMERECTFPNSMVDRITPATTDDDRRDLLRRTGVIDARPVVCEPFIQWVLEDAFVDGRPPLEEAGVQVVTDVQPYELAKLRLLNGSHQALAYFAALLGIQTVDQAIGEPLLAKFVAGYMAEATSTLKPPTGLDLNDYKRTLIARFSNSAIGDTVERLCAYSSDRIPKFVLPVIRDQLDDGRPIDFGVAIVASWARYAEGSDEHGRTINVVDNRAAGVSRQARSWPGDALAFIRDRALFGDLAADERFAAVYERTLESLHERGTRDTLARLFRGVL